MAATISIFNSFKKKIVDGTNVDLTSGKVKVALCTSAYTPNIDTHDFYNDITNELSGGGYTAGGNLVITSTVYTDTANDRTVWDGLDASWSTLTATNVRYGIFYSSETTSAASYLIGYCDFGENKTFASAKLKITWHTNGISLIS